MILIRALKILFIFGRYRLDRILPDKTRVKQTLPLRLLAKLFPLPKQDSAESARLALESLGPIFVKFGQLLSTRPDLLSERMAMELSRLQDEVAPFPTETARKIIEESLGSPIETKFRDFDPVPLASASLAQIHTARIRDRTGDHEIVIKILRPNIMTVIRKDIRLMYFVAGMFEKLWKEAGRLHPIQIVRDYEKTILRELDLTQEAKNTIQLRENWYQSGKLYVPRVFDKYSDKNLMVMERINGVPANDIETLTARKVNLKKLAHLGVEIFFKQVFEDNFFHADMHPGNVFINTADPDNPSYIALDCAIIGSLSEEDKNYIARNLLAFFRRDYEEVARLHVRSGWVPPDTNIIDLSKVIQQVVDPFFQKPIKEISFGTVMLQLFRTAREFNMEIQPQLVLLQKTLINIEGMGRQIYPELDLWETAAPFMEVWIRKRRGINALVGRITKNAPRWIEQLPDFPDLILNTMHQMGELSSSNRKQVEMLSELKSSLSVQTRKTRSQRLGGIAMIAAIFSMLLPTTGLATSIDPIISGSVLGSIGIYWMYIHS